MKKLFAIFAALLLSGNIFAHEGHDHDGPVKVQAPKGGMIKMLDDSYLEVVNKGKTFNIYLYDKDLKPIDAKTFAITAKVQKPRGKTMEDVKLEAKDLNLEGSFDAKGIHRYTLILNVKSPKEEHADTVKFTIEPKK